MFFKKSTEMINNRARCYINQTGVLLHGIKKGLGGKAIMEDKTLWRVIGDSNLDCDIGTEIIVRGVQEKVTLKVVVF